MTEEQTDKEVLIEEKPQLVFNEQDALSVLTKLIDKGCRFKLSSRRNGTVNVDKYLDTGEIVFNNCIEF